MADGPLLTICIPTYNRSALLLQTLNTVISQLDDDMMCTEVAIVVSDNASSDETQELVTRLRDANPRIHLRYFRQQSNLGPDANIYTAIRLATGTFVYILSDDDVILPNALHRFVSALSTNPELVTLCPNNRFMSSASGELSMPTFAMDDDYLIFDKDEALTRLGVMLTFVSCLIFRREALAKRDYTDRIGTSLLQSFIFLEVLARDDGCLFIKQPCLAVRTNDAVSYDLFEVFGTNFHTLMKYAEQLGYSSGTIETILVTHAKWLVGMVYHFKMTGSYRPSLRDTIVVLGRLWSVYRGHPLVLCRVSIAVMLPPGAFRALLRLFQNAQVCHKVLLQRLARHKMRRT